MADRNQFRLLGERRFAPFFVTQFLGVLNDNVYKNALVILVAFHATSLTTLPPEVLVNLAGALFILPFFLFSATAGQLADKYDKAAIMRLVKLFEIAIMTIGAIGFVRGSLALLLAALFLMGLHSTVFGPVKYAILPQTLKEEELVGGNALVETGTSLAILAGTIAGGLLVAAASGPTLLVPVATIGLAVAGYAASRFVPGVRPPTPELRVNWNPFTETWANFQFTRRNRTVFLSILGVSWFWFYGAMFLTQFPVYARTWLGGGESVVTLLLTVFSVGIGIGSLLCERMSGHKVEIGLVPFGAIGLSIFAFDLFFATPDPAAAQGLAVLEYMRAGRPARADRSLPHRAVRRLLHRAALRAHPEPVGPLAPVAHHRGKQHPELGVHRGRGADRRRVPAARRDGAAALPADGTRQRRGRGVHLHAGPGVPDAVPGVAAHPRRVPHRAVRARARAGGGAALVVCNHVSFVDAVVIMGVCRRPIRFVMDHNIFKVPVLNFIFRTAGAIPIAGRKDDPEMMERAFAAVAQALRDGQLVGIFPEGRITDSGEIQPFRPGIARILAATPVPVVPMALRGLWGSFFSRKDAPAMTRPFRRGVWSRIGLAVAPPVAAELATPEALQAQVSELRGGWR